jgi:hypothetical protein
MNDCTLFAFEDDFVATLRCIPMAVRFKLDACEVKVSLRQWSRFTPDERRALLMQPCQAQDDVDAYRTYLLGLIGERANGAALGLPPGSTVAWDQTDATPEAVRLFARCVRAPPPSDAQWAALTPLQRFVLLKLSRDNHDNVNFIPALREFGLYREGLPASAGSYAASA